MVLNPSNTATFAKYKDANTTFVLFLFFATTKAAQQLCCHRRRKRWQQCWGSPRRLLCPIGDLPRKEALLYVVLLPCFSTDNTLSNTYPYALEYSAWFSQVKMINELSAQILSHNVQGMSLVWFWFYVCCQRIHFKQMYPLIIRK